MKEHFSKHRIKSMILNALTDILGAKDPAAASDELYYKACVIVIKDILEEQRKKFMAHVYANAHKQVYYLSMEFLLGRSLKNSLFNLNMIDTFQEALAECDVNLERLYGYEPDPGLGNGGLGRLAACYLDAAATQKLPATGYSILYEYGIFKQKITEGWQTELPDYWLPGGEVWLAPHPDRTVQVRFGGEIEEIWRDSCLLLTHKNYQSVMAVPYDIHISGYGSSDVSMLRLWRAESPMIDMESFNRGDYAGAFRNQSLGEAISKVLYPNDNHNEGKTLRLRQQYFLCAASIADIVRRHMAVYDTLDNFADQNAIHINDTHPTLAIPELMRILLDDCGYSWETAWDTVTRTFAYTNHTILTEALETWDEDMFRQLLPRIYVIIHEINERFCQQLANEYQMPMDTISRMAIISYRMIKMAHLAIVGSHSVNGVSALHSQIIREGLFRDFYLITPRKFINVTNGIASRRWLGQNNTGMVSLLKKTIGPDFLEDMSKLEALSQYKNDSAVLSEIARIKLQNKQNFSDYVKRTTGEILNPHSIFDVQLKRLHEYKRQHLNALHILSLYQYLKDNPQAPFTPQTFIFGAKAAPGYFMAKQIIRLIWNIGQMIQNDPAVRDKLHVIYLEDYKVTLSEIVMPAAEISEQISQAGKEASGTGNMKLMLSGAVTLGTLDGANIEIRQAVGDENILIFGMNAQQVRHLEESGYDPRHYYSRDSILKQALDSLNTGINGEQFPEIHSSLTSSDPFMVLADFDSYRQIQQRAQELYRDQNTWQSMALMNTAKSGYFCADRAVMEYAQKIWGMHPVR